MRALWTAASGMKAQQLNIDTISNNLANVNTVGYKKQRAEFQDLLYEKLIPANFEDGEGKPVNLEVGHGVMTSAIARDFSQGNLERTDNPYDMAIDGDGFFQVQDSIGNTFYTKDGTFKISVDDASGRLVTSDGYYLQGDGGIIELGENIRDVEISKTGQIRVKRLDSDEFEDVATVSLYNFVNPAGLESVGSNLLKETPASGVAAFSENGEAGTVRQGFIERSNVQVVDEMINMITAQRAYEINSKAIQTADQMLEMANNLKR